MRAPLLLLMLVAMPGARLVAQERDPLEAAMRSYQDLEYDSAAAQFRQALRAPALLDSLRARALMHLGATEILRSRRDLASAAFRALVQLDPRYRPDQLRFPPEIVAGFHEARLATRLVAAVLPAETRIAGPADRLIVRLYASTVHEISATVQPQGSQRVVSRALYTGAIGDSLELLWDGRTATGAMADSGSYELRLISRGADGRPVRQLIVPLALRRLRVDTLPWPPAPAESLLRRETEPGRGGGGALLAGMLTAGATVLLPALAGSDDAMAARYVVASAGGVAGIVGLLRARRPRPVPANIAWNRRLTTAWEAEAERIRQQNDALRREQGLTITAGPPTGRNLP